MICARIHTNALQRADGETRARRSLPPSDVLAPLALASAHEV